ncbi:MAG: TonB-dependent receptor [Sphingomonadales bacterium]|nr:TonB-dependent receptor [Sphingomonadales bacterium]
MRAGTMQSSLLGSAAVVVMACAGAVAQDDTEREIEQLIIKGLKRDTTFLEVPASVSVFDEEAISNAGVKRPQDYLRLIPNVTFIQANHAGEAFVNIRGQASVRQSESAVAVVIDGVQLSTQNEFNGELFDLQQIEVLKGPQGALYGRNAAAGAIIVTTKSPTDDLEGQATLTAGNWDTYKANASLGGAIVPEKLRFRVAGSVNTSDGPFKNIVTGEDSYRSEEALGRVRLDWLVNENLTLDMRAGISHLTGGATAANAQVAGSTVGGIFVPAADTNNADIPFVADVPGDNRQSKFNASVKADYEMDIGTLTSVTAWNQITDNYQAKNFPYAAFADPRNDFGVFAAVFGDRTQKFRIANRAFTQEIRLTSPSDQRIRWQAGFYFLSADRYFTTEQGLNGRPILNPDGTIMTPVIFNPDGTLTRNLMGGGAILPTFGIDGIDTVNPTDLYDDNKYGFTNYAPFGNVQVDITEDLELSAAVRYDVEKRSVQTLTPDIPNPVTGAPTYNLCVLNTGRAASDCRESETFKQVQPKVTLTYKFGNNGSVFASYGRSFKSGGFNPIGTRAALLASPGADPDQIFVQDAYGKEVADSFELGFKSVWGAGRVTLNGALFYTDVSNAQQFEFFPSAGIQAVSSIDQVEIKGFELDGTLRINDSVSLFAGFGYIDSTVKELRAAPQFEGNRAPFSYNYNIVAGTQVVHPIANSMDFLFRLQYTRTGTIWWDAANLDGTRRDPIDLIDARIGVAAGRWEFALWSQNLTNEKYNSEAVPLLAIINAVFKAPTRSYGAEAKIRF